MTSIWGLDLTVLFNYMTRVLNILFFSILLLLNNIILIALDSMFNFLILFTKFLITDAYPELRFRTYQFYILIFRLYAITVSNSIPNQSFSFGQVYRNLYFEYIVKNVLCFAQYDSYNNCEQLYHQQHHPLSSEDWNLEGKLERCFLLVYTFEK